MTDGKLWASNQIGEPVPAAAKRSLGLQNDCAKGLTFMADWNQNVALVVNGEAFSLADLLRRARWRDQLAFVSEAVDAALIRQAMAERGLAATDEELQLAADEYRAARELYLGAELRRHLAGLGLTIADWELMLEDEVLRRKQRAAVTENQIERYFAENKLAFDAATLSHLMTREQDVAREIRVQVVEEEADFHRLARRHSVDEATRPAGGYIGLVRRGELDPIAAAAVFGAEPGKVVGPLKTDLGWRLVLVHALRPAALDNVTREEIRTKLFEQWLAALRNSSRVVTPLLENEGQLGATGAANNAA
jgi:parvulin-like peptidyl-prolyl isomerase